MQRFWGWYIVGCKVQLLRENLHWNTALTVKEIFTVWAFGRGHWLNVSCREILSVLPQRLNIVDINKEGDTPTHTPSGGVSVHGMELWQQRQFTLQFLQKATWFLCIKKQMNLNHLTLLECTEWLNFDQLNSQLEEVLVFKQLIWKQHIAQSCWLHQSGSHQVI